MSKDLILGAASNYSWNDLKYWVNSINATGFAGDVVLVASNITKETIDKLSSKNVKLALYGKQDEKGNFTAPENLAPHVARFFYMWDFLERAPEEYDTIVVTDTRDVIFQKDPIRPIRENYITSMRDYVISSEGMLYQNEPWGNKNLYDTFGPFFHDKLKDRLIYNVGTIGGIANSVKDLFLLLFQMSINRPISIVDQAVFNFIMNMDTFREKSYGCTNSVGWAIQLGTTVKAIEAGYGDLGLICKNNPSRLDQYKIDYLDSQPKYTEDGMILNDNDLPFSIVHQYDRIPGLKEKIQEKYGDD